jgi:hypothetical protein
VNVRSVNKSKYVDRKFQTTYSLHAQVKKDTLIRQHCSFNGLNKKIKEEVKEAILIKRRLH